MAIVSRTLAQAPAPTFANLDYAPPEPSTSNGHRRFSLDGRHRLDFLDKYMKA